MSQSSTRGDISLENWRQHPFSRWSFQNVCELVPVAGITAPSAPEPQPETPGLLATVRLKDPDGRTLSAIDHLQRSHADNFVVMRDGIVLDDWLRTGCDPAAPHIIFSISKSLTGMLAGIAAGEGRLDPNAPITRYIAVSPESAYADARIRDLLDMTVSLDFKEDYLDLDGPFDRYRRAMLWNPDRPGAKPESLRDVLSSLPRKPGRHGERCFYASPNTDLLGLVIEKATGVRFHTYLAERLWRPMGARGGAYVTVDRSGTARAAGGVCVTAHDLARLGQLVLDSGRAASGKQLIPADWITDMRTNGNRQAWADGDFATSLPNGHYRSCWYAAGDGRGSFCCIGIHGQWLWVDPTSRVVLAKVSSRPEPSDDALSRREVDMLGQIARAI